MSEGDPEVDQSQEGREAAGKAAGERGEDATLSLEAKMAGWDASEEERRASTLGGNLPLIGMPTSKTDGKGIDGFDVGMNISGIILLPLALLVLTVPIWIGSIDVSDVGPPPTS